MTIKIALYQDCFQLYGYLFSHVCSRGQQCDMYRIIHLSLCPYTQMFVNPDVDFRYDNIFITGPVNWWMSKKRDRVELEADWTQIFWTNSVLPVAGSRPSRKPPYQLCHVFCSTNILGFGTMNTISIIGVYLYQMLCVKTKLLRIALTFLGV